MLMQRNYTYLQVCVRKMRLPRGLASPLLDLESRCDQVLPEQTHKNKTSMCRSLVEVRISGARPQP